MSAETPRVLPRGQVVALLHRLAPLWLAVRHGRWLIPAALLFFLAAGTLIDEKSKGVDVSLLSLLIGLICGLSVFGGDRPCGLPAASVRIWLGKTLFWLAAAAAMGLAACVVPFVNKYQSGHDSVPHTLNIGLRNHALFTALCVVHGFCFGQFFAMLMRRIVMAALFAYVASLLVLAAWIPVLCFGNWSAWRFFVVPSLLLLASAFSAPAWSAGKGYSRQHWFRLIGCGALSILWVVGSLWHRAVEIPEVGEPFDLAAFDESMKAGAASETGRLVEQAAAELRAQEKKVAAKLGKERWFHFEDILKKGWPAEDAEIGQWFDEMFADPWANHFRQAAQMPLGAPFENNYCRWAGWLFVMRAIQLQSHGDDAAALEHLETALALSRHVMLFFFSGQPNEHDALAGFDRWLQNTSREPNLLRKALEFLRQHEAQFPGVENLFKLDHFGLRQTLDSDVCFTEHRLPSADLRKKVLNAAWHVPWEHERQIRLLNAAFQGRMHNTKLLPILGSPESDLEFALAFGLPLPDGPTTKLSANEWGAVLRDSWETTRLLYWRRDSGQVGSQFLARSLVNVRLQQLVFALALYEAEKQMPAAKLEDLVPAYLPAIPLDPYLNEPFKYRISTGEEVHGVEISRDWIGSEMLSAKLVPGQALIWLNPLYANGLIRYHPIRPRSKK